MKNKKGMLGFEFLQAGAVSIFVVALVVVITLVGMQQLQTVSGGNAAGSSLIQNSTYNNITSMIGAVGGISPYTTLIVTIIIFVFIIGLVNGALKRNTD